MKIKFLYTLGLFVLIGNAAFASPKLIQVKLTRPTVYEYPNTALKSLIEEAEQKANSQCGRFGILRDIKASTPSTGWYGRSLSAIFTFECQ